jgi:CBS domain containing-hemolysin-like protein
MILVLLVFLLAASALLSASETALFSLSPLVLKNYKQSLNPRHKLIASLMEHPRDVLVTILILNVSANILVQNAASSFFDGFPGWSLKVGVPLVLTLVFGEIIPKSIAIPNQVAIADKAAPWIYRISKLLRYIRDPLTHATAVISRFVFFFLKKEKGVSSQELRHMLKTSEIMGVLLPQESDLIEGLLDLETALVKEKMRPREEVIFYDIDQPVAKLMHLFVDQEVSKIPVCKKSLDQVQGILSLDQFFFHKQSILSGNDVIPFLKKPYFIPESTKAWVLFKNLKEKNEDMALAVDEYGSISGLITQEDLVESVVGNIVDLRDSHPLYTRSSQDMIIASGKLELVEFKEIFGVPLVSQYNNVTLGGWLIEQLGDIPLTGTKYANDQFLFYILAADPNRIRRVYVRYLHPKEIK